MATPNRPLPQNQYSEQYIENTSYDTDFGVSAREVLGYDGQNLQRTNASNLKVIYYSDATYDYYCFAAPGTSVSSSNWLVKRVDTNGQVDYPSGSSSFNKAATNLTTVQGYTYS